MKPIQTYKTSEITVTFDPNVCIHSAVCLKSLPAVFDLNSSPWIHVEAAAAEQIRATIDQCPSGALQYVMEKERSTSRPATAQQTATLTTIQLMENGPLMIKGQFVVMDENGTHFETKQTVALCRCGGTATPPFCDGTHQKIGFKPKG